MIPPPMTTTMSMGGERSQRSLTAILREPERGRVRESARKGVTLFPRYRGNWLRT